MFSIDYPFEKPDLAVRFLREARLGETERSQVASQNARRILHLDRPIGNHVAPASSPSRVAPVS